MMRWAVADAEFRHKIVATRNELAGWTQLSEVQGWGTGEEHLRSPRTLG